MPASHDPFSTVGLGPDDNPLKDMDNLSQINDQPARVCWRGRGSWPCQCSEC